MGVIKEKTTKVLSFDDIVLHNDSINFLETVFQQYNRVEQDDNMVFKNPLVHIYPLEDTRDSSGELNGFHDALFFEARIYDPYKKEYAISKYNDSLDTLEADITAVRIFKDGSTLVEFRGFYKFGNLTALCVHKVDNPASLPTDLPYLPFN